MKKIKNIFRKFNNTDTTMKVSIILLLLIIIIGIFQGFYLLEDYSKISKDNDNIENKISTPNIQSKQSGTSANVGGTQQNTNPNGNINNNTNNNANNNTNDQSNISSTINKIQTGLPVVIIFTSGTTNTGRELDRVNVETESKSQWLQNQYKGKIIVQNMNFLSNKYEINKYNIQGYPTTLILNSKGEEIGRFSGIWTEKQIIDKLSSIGIQ